MRIKQILSQHRRDFTAIYICQHCGHETEGDGYDDSYFHTEVIPKMKCKKCGEIGGEVTSTNSVPEGVIL